MNLPPTAATGSTGPTGPADVSSVPSPSRVAPIRASCASSPWLELFRVSALFSVPGDLLTGAAAAGARPGRRTLLATGSSLCLYEAGMALNDWADRDTDAVERPGRPIPSGRIAPAAALGAAAGLTGAGLALAAAAGRPSLVTATALAATVWAYDLHLKNTPAGPLAMAWARALDVLQGAASVAPVRSGRAIWTLRRALPSAALLGTHTLAVTTVSRREAQGSSPALPLAALGVVAAVGRVVGGARGIGGPSGSSGSGGTSELYGASRSIGPVGTVGANGNTSVTDPVTKPLANALPDAFPASLARPLARAAAVLYAGTAARPFFHAALNPSPYLLQRAVGSGIRAMIPLQAALAARAGAPGTGAALLALVPAARRLSRKVSPT
ncbi:SCO3242 family prenyltransferase [Streptomyces sp. NPDC045456]|uniref:SCO3242 family prenyltransferase n=1 Tax=Streptomyces sp. NPDC045456 TaxID=3155254 RepID=UPI0033E4AD9E